MARRGTFASPEHSACPVCGKGRGAQTPPGWDDAAICAELGVEADELVRLKHVTGFSKLFENVEYRRSWETKRQIGVRIDFQKGQKNENPEPKAA